MADVLGKITLKLLILPAAGLETLEEFELGLEEVYERECNSDSDVNEISLMNRNYHLATGSVSIRLHKEF